MSISAYYAALNELHTMERDGLINDQDFAVQRHLLARLRQEGEFNGQE